MSSWSRTVMAARQGALFHCKNRYDPARKMYGVVLPGHDVAELLQWHDDLNAPVAGKGDVVVRVSADGVNNTDISTRTGWYSNSGGAAHDAGWTGEPLTFPRIEGIDGCGHIAAVGEDVGPARFGKHILIKPCQREARSETLKSLWYIGSECGGGFARFIRAESRHAYTVDSDLTDVELAWLACSYSTAENVLTRAGVRTGQNRFDHRRVGRDWFGHRPTGPRGGHV